MRLDVVIEHGTGLLCGCRARHRDGSPSPSPRRAFARCSHCSGSKDEGSACAADGQQALAGRPRGEDAEVQHGNATLGGDAEAHAGPAGDRATRRERNDSIDGTVEGRLKKNRGISGMKPACALRTAMPGGMQACGQGPCRRRARPA